MIMAAEPVAVKPTAPAPAAGPDVWQLLRSEMERVFDRFATNFGSPTFGRFFDLPRMPATSLTMLSPAVEITEDPTSYRLTAELPGMSETDIEVELSGAVLSIKGEKKQEAERKEKNTYLSERSYGMFRRSFMVPDGVDRDKIEAKFTNGVLTLSMPKRPSAVHRPKKIDVKAAG
jgi:HSP20 family protein